MCCQWVEWDHGVLVLWSQVLNRNLAWGVTLPWYAWQWVINCIMCGLYSVSVFEYYFSLDIRVLMSLHLLVELKKKVLKLVSIHYFMIDCRRRCLCLYYIVQLGWIMFYQLVFVTFFCFWVGLSLVLISSQIPIHCMCRWGKTTYTRLYYIMEIAKG